MGYWFPPPPTVFNPWPRPLHWFTDVDGPYPQPEDEHFYGCGRSQLKTPPVNVQVAPNQYQWIYPPGCPENVWDDTKGPWKNYGDLVCVGGYGSGFNYNDKTPAQRLEYYRKMIKCRVPAMNLYGMQEGDPEGGGLCPDSATATAAFIHYFDCSDSNEPKRKVIIYYTDGKTDPEVKEWKPNDQKWEGEGFDWDKDLPKLFMGALQVIQAAGSAALAYFTANPAAIGAFQGMMKNMISAAAPGGRIDPGATLQAIFGPAIADKSFQSAMLSDIKKNQLLGSLYTETGQIKAAADEAAAGFTSILSAYKGAIEKYKDVIPKISMGDTMSLVQGQLPPSMQVLDIHAYTKPDGAMYGQPIPPAMAKAQGQPGIVVDAVQKATVAWIHRYDDEIIHYSYRKLFNLGSTVGVDSSMALSWRDSFDATYASLQASEVSIKAPKGKGLSPVEYTKSITDMTVSELEAAIVKTKANYQTAAQTDYGKTHPQFLKAYQANIDQMVAILNQKKSGSTQSAVSNPIQALMSLIATLKMRYQLS